MAKNMTKVVDDQWLVSRGDSQYTTNSLNKVVCWMLVLLMGIPWMLIAQDPEQLELVTPDRTKRVIHMKGRKARLAAERMRQGDSDIETAAQFLSGKGFRPNGNAFVFYSEDSNTPGRYRGLNIEVMFQGFINAADQRAILAVARQPNGQIARGRLLANVSALRIDLNGNIIEQYNILRNRDGRRRAGIVPLKNKEPIMLAKLIALQEFDPNNHPDSPDYMEPNPSDFGGFYGCSSGACATGFLAGLFAMPLGPEASAVAFVTTCVLGTLSCGYTYLGLPIYLAPVAGPLQNPNAPNRSNREAPVGGYDDDFGPFPYVPPSTPGCQGSPDLYGPGC